MPFKYYGGVHPDYAKTASKTPVRTISPPPVVVLPMIQQIGAPNKPVVKVGDTVKMGQLIGTSDAPVSAPVHASVSGKVIAVEPRRHMLGDMVMSVVIENDFQDTPCEDMKPLTEEQLQRPGRHHRRASAKPASSAWAARCSRRPSRSRARAARWTPSS